MSIVTPNVGEGSYALYDGLDSIGYNCIQYLMSHDEVIWKLLKYNTPDAWQMPDLSAEQKGELIYKGGDDAALFNVFMDMGQPDVITNEICVIRIHPYHLTAKNRVVGDIHVMTEVYSHYKINHLSNYKTRNDMIIQRFLQVFNGANIKGLLGNLAVDDLGTYGTKMETAGQLPFRGKWVLFGSHSN